MNNLLTFILGALLLVILYQYFNGQRVQRTAEYVTETTADLGQKVGTGARRLVDTATGLAGDVVEQVGDLFDGDEEKVAMAAAAHRSEQASEDPNAPMGPPGAVSIPMKDSHAGSYPSGILPGKVGTFHPTKDCDRFVCTGCLSCGPRREHGCCMTDDRGRNYPALIDTIRASRTNEYPFYKMN